MLFERVAIPHITLAVLPLTLGNLTFGTPVGQAEAIRLVRWAIDQGVNAMDIATMCEVCTRCVGSAEAQARGRSLMQHATITTLEQPAAIDSAVGVKRIKQPKELNAGLE